jgi:glycosyltransferase involved in cell wall biosynthesis
MTASTATVVVCTYSEQRLGELQASVESLRAQSVAPVTIVVVVDGDRALLERIRGALTDVEVVPNEYPQGLAGARNTGAGLAEGDVVAFLDDDAEAAPDWLEHLTAHYADETVLGVGGAVEPLWSQARPGWFPPEFDWVVGCGYRGLPTRAAPIRNFIGANMSFRRALLQEAGGFRLSLGRVGTNAHGCEETELCIRIGQRWPHGRLLYDPGARVYHRVPPERTSWRYFGRRCYAEGISKASVVRAVGRCGLSSERTHASRVLTRAMARGLVDAVAEADGDALRRALAITAGFAAASAGYGVESLRGRARRAAVSAE